MIVKEVVEEWMETMKETKIRDIELLLKEKENPIF